MKTDEQKAIFYLLDNIATYDILMAKAETLKAKIRAIPVEKEIRPLGGG